MDILKKLLNLVKTLGQQEELNQEDHKLIDTLCSEDEIPLDLARATLLVDIALIDCKFDSREYDFIMNTLKSDLTIDDITAKQLIINASVLVQYRGCFTFAKEIQRKLSLEQRKKIAIAIENLIRIDNNNDGFEIYLKNKINDLLGVN